MSDLTLPDDLKQWQDALDARDLAKQAYDSFKGSLQAKALLAEVLIQARQRLEMLRKEHMTGEESGDVGKSETPEGGVGDQMPWDGSKPSACHLDEIYGIYSEDEYHDNRERGRT